MPKHTQARGVAIPLNPDRVAAWPGGGFRPDGPLYYVGELARMDFRSNPIARKSDGSEERYPAGASARLFVGFNVQGVPRWSLDDLLPIVERVRVAQTGDPNSTFLFTRGLYRNKSGLIERGEQGAQVIIVDERSRTAAEFENEMVALAEAIAAGMDQEKVFVELLRAGNPQETVAVVPL